MAQYSGSNKNPALILDGIIFLQGDHLDVYGNALANGVRVGVRVIGGALATIANTATFTNTVIQPPVGSETLASGGSVTLAAANVAYSPNNGAVGMTGFAPTLAH